MCDFVTKLYAIPNTTAATKNSKPGATTSLLPALLPPPVALALALALADEAAELALEEAAELAELAAELAELTAELILELALETTLDIDEEMLETDAKGPPGFVVNPVEEATSVDIGDPEMRVPPGAEEPVMVETLPVDDGVAVASGSGRGRVRVMVPVEVADGVVVVVVADGVVSFGTVSIVTDEESVSIVAAAEARTRSRRKILKDSIVTVTGGLI